MPLRDYQQTIYNQILTELRTNIGVCAVLPCRSGKSYIMKELVDLAVKHNRKVLILAHRHLLLNQHARLITGARIESVFTEINHLGERERPDLIIIDEAHLSGAESYQRVCEYYGCKRVLFTATASRLDGKPLSLATTIINGISGDELIERGDVAPYDLYAPKIGVDVSGVKMSGSDYNIDALAEIMLNRKIYGDIVRYYDELARGRQAIAYCVNVEHSKAVCELFNNHNIPAVHIDASTPERERERIMMEYKAGRWLVLCNCNLISEGITLPECDCCLLLRPTQSETLYIQQACRCLTPREGKRAIIIDYVGNAYAHGMPTEKRTYSLTERLRPRNDKRTEGVCVRMCEHCFRIYAGTSPICPYCKHNNGRTKQQIEADERAELERVEAIRKRDERREVGMCRTFAQLVELGRKRGYRNPAYWASQVIKARESKI